MSYRGRRFEFKKQLHYGQPVYVCDAQDDLISRSLVNIPPYTLTPPVIFRKKSSSNLFRLVGSYVKKISVMGAAYTFVPDNKNVYPFRLALIPEHHAKILIVSSSHLFWYAEDIEKFRAVVREQAKKKKLKNEIKYTLKTVDQAEEQARKLMEMGDKRELNEVLFDIYTHDASRKGFDVIPPEQLSKRPDQKRPGPRNLDDLRKQKEKEEEDKLIKKMSGFSQLVEQGKQPVKVNEKLQAIQRLVTPEDLPGLEKDLKKMARTKTSKVNTGEYTVQKMKKFLRDNIFTIDELQVMADHELKDTNRVSIISLIREEIKKIRRGERNAINN